MIEILKELNGYLTMSETAENIIIVIVSILVGTVFGAFINSWWKRPRLSLKINPKRNHTFFLKPVDPTLVMQGVKNPLPKLYLQIGFTLQNKGDSTSIANGKIKYKMKYFYSNWYDYIDTTRTKKDYTTLDVIVGTQPSLIGKNKNAIIGKNDHLDGYLTFEIPIINTPENVKCKLKIIPINGCSTIKRFKIYPFRS